MKKFKILDIYPYLATVDNMTSSIEDSDDGDGDLLFHFSQDIGKDLYVVVEFNHTDKLGDRRDMFYSNVCPKELRYVLELIMYLSHSLLYIGYDRDEAERVSDRLKT